MRAMSVLHSVSMETAAFLSGLNVVTLRGLKSLCGQKQYVATNRVGPAQGIDLSK